MTRTAPVVIAALVGFLMVVAYFVPPLLSWRQTAEEWYAIVATIALMLGGVNLCTHHLKKISDQAAGWGFSAVTLASFGITVLVGLLKVGVVPESVKHLDRAWSGQFQQEGMRLLVAVSIPVHPSGFDHVCTSGILRRVRGVSGLCAKNLEAVLLLLTALIVLIGQTKDREITSLFMPVPADGSLPYFPIADLTEFIRKTFVTAGQRAIMIGVALGVVATSMRILLGLDRSYLGGDE